MLNIIFTASQKNRKLGEDAFRTQRFQTTRGSLLSGNQKLTK